MSYSGVYDVEFLLMRDARKWKWVVYAAKSLSHSFNNDDAAKSQLEMNKTSLMVRSWQWNFHSALISIAFRFSSAESRLLGDLTFKRISIHCCRRKFPASEKQEMQKCKKLAHKEDNYVKDIVCDSARLLYQILFVASARGESPRQEGDEGATMRWGSALQVGPSVPLALTRNVSNRKLAIIVSRFNPRWSVGAW